MNERESINDNLNSNNNVMPTNNINTNSFNENMTSNIGANNITPSSVNNNASSMGMDLNNNEKKGNNFLLYLCIFILMIASCMAVYFMFRSPNTKDEVETDIDMTSQLFSKETLPRVDASLATQPLVDALVKNFTGNTTKELGIEYTNTHPGYVKLINNETDLIVVTEPSAEELALAKQNNVELEVTKVVNEGFIFFVNKENPVNNITFEQVQKIYTGEITNWKELGGNDSQIVAFQRPVNSGSQTGLLSLVMKGKQVKVPTTKEQVETMAGIVDIVADYDNGLNSIGYSYYYYANVMYKNDNLKYLGINGVIPEYNTIQDGSYPILTAYYIVTRKGETNENVAKLKEAMLSERGQKVASEAGYVPAK